MREILFKAKRVDNGEWVEGNLYRPSGLLKGIYISLDCTCFNFYPDLDHLEGVTQEMMDNHVGISIGKFIEVIPETVMIRCSDGEFRLIGDITIHG